MTPENFCYWMQGYAELTNDLPTPAQWNSIKEHLNLVFNKVTSPVDKRKIVPAIDGRFLTDVINGPIC